MIMIRDEVVENGLLRCWPQPDHPCSELLHILTIYHKDQRPNQPDSEFLYILSHFDQNTLHCMGVAIHHNNQHDNINQSHQK